MIRLGNIGGSAASGGSGSSVGGGASVYSTAQDDFTATINNGTKTITTAGLPFTLETKHVVNGLIKKTTSADVVTTVPLTKISVSSSVITLADADDFVTGDTVEVTLVGPDKGFDKQGWWLNQIMNPNYDHYTSPEQLIDESDLGIDGVHDGGNDASDFTDTGEVFSADNVAEGYLIYNVTDVSNALVDIGGAGNPTADDIAHAALSGGTDDDWDDSDVASIPEVKRFVFPAESFNFNSIHAKITAGAANKVFLKVYGTNIAAADDTSDDDWEDLSVEILGASDINATAGTTTTGIFFVDTPTVILKYCVKIVAEVSDGVQDNDFDVYLKKAS